MPKLGKTDARDIAGVHVAIVQPFAVLDGIELLPIVQQLPHFLLDSDSLTQELSELRIRRTCKFVSIDIHRLYPTIDLHCCLDAVRQHSSETRWRWLQLCGA